MDRPITSKSRGVCKYYTTDRGCFAGEQCKFLHGADDKYTPFDKSKKCKFFAQGFCRRGDQCWFRHVSDPQAMSTATDDICNICLDKPITYGLLTDCNHIFCDKCIRQWRNPSDRASDTAISGVTKMCPLCRSPSRFIIPSSRYFSPGDPAKAEAIENYKASMARIPCKYYAASLRSRPSSPFCPFGKDCFYQHVHPDGKPFLFPHGAEHYLKISRRRRASTRGSSDARFFTNIISFGTLRHIFGDEHDPFDVFGSIIEPGRDFAVHDNQYPDGAELAHNEPFASDDMDDDEFPNNVFVTGLLSIFEDLEMDTYSPAEAHAAVGQEPHQRSHSGVDTDIIRAAPLNDRSVLMSPRASTTSPPLLASFHGLSKPMSPEVHEENRDPGSSLADLPIDRSFDLSLSFDAASDYFLPSSAQPPLSFPPTPLVSGSSSSVSRFSSGFVGPRRQEQFIIDLASEDEEDEDNDSSADSVGHFDASAPSEGFDHVVDETGQTLLALPLSDNVSSPSPDGGTISSRENSATGDEAFSSSPSSPWVAIEHEAEPPFVTDGRGRVVWSSTRGGRIIPSVDGREAQNSTQRSRGNNTSKSEDWPSRRYQNSGEP